MVEQISILIGVLIAIIIVQFIIIAILLLRKPKKEENEHSIEAREWQRKDDFQSKISKIQKRLK
jgi:hypothetical protein